MRRLVENGIGIPPARASLLRAPSITVHERGPANHGDARDFVAFCNL
jgi:hypothetical protein